jgi:hypothetical protein
VRELKEPQIQRQLLLRDASMAAEPIPQQGPESLQRIDVDLAEAFPVVIPGEFVRTMGNGVLSVSPLW